MITQIGRQIGSVAVRIIISLILGAAAGVTFGSIVTMLIGGALADGTMVESGEAWMATLGTIFRIVAYPTGVVAAFVIYVQMDIYYRQGLN